MFLEEDVSDDDEKIKTSKRPYSEVNFAFSFFLIPWPELKRFLHYVIWAVAIIMEISDQAVVKVEYP